VSARERALAIALLALLVTCAPREEREAGSKAQVGGGALASTAPVKGDRSGGAPAEAPSAAADRAEAAPEELDPVVSSLLQARIVALKPTPFEAGGPFAFEATLEGALAFRTSASERGAATLVLAQSSAPIAYRRSLALHRLAAALDLHIVPAAALRPISVGDLGALLQADPRALAQIRARARVQNDGTVDALLIAPAPTALGSPWTRPRSVSISPSGSVHVRTWERWAESPTPVPGEHPTLLRDFVELLVLDYLAAVITRRTILFLPEAGALLLDDNREVFPLHADAASVESLLLRLRSVARFPRGLRDALTRFDRSTAALAFEPAGFESWLLSPRSLIELDERRAGLLSLIEAQVAERGAGAVLCL
jgi:hypothetical protein